MNKLILFGLLFLIFGLIKSQLPRCDAGTESIKQTLQIAEIDEDVCMMLIPGDDNTHCCFVTNSKHGDGCMPINDDEFENIVRFKKCQRDNDDDPEFSIKCSSGFISFSLLAALALFI